MNQTPKYHITTLGCKVNTYESEAVSQLLESHGYTPSNEGDPVDLHVINTCAVTQVSEGKSRQMIRRAIQSDPEATIVVMGCYSQLEAKTVQSIDGVDIVLGTSHRHEIPNLVNSFLTAKEPLMKVDNLFIHPSFDPLQVTTYSDNTRAFLKIQEGCNNYCSFCIIPVTRGPIRSRSKEDIFAEAQRLVESGFKEIVLTGIHTAGYGEDLTDYSFSQLLRDFATQVPSLNRLRISSIEASQISNELVDIMANTTMLVNHLHIPIQSGSDSVLERMRRKYKTSYLKDKIATLRSRFPRLAITTDVIVGFPGESEQEFLETYKFIEDIGFSALHVFPYSSRKGTLASSMKNQINPKIKHARVILLRQLSEQLHTAYASSFIGETLTVLGETFDEDKGIIQGHTTNYLKLSYKGNKYLINQIVNVKIESVTNQQINGIIV